jgi:hypothetical protein
VPERPSERRLGRRALRLLADALTRAGEALRRVAEGAPAAAHGGPPEHWAERVRAAAPHLLDPDSPLSEASFDVVPHGDHDDPVEPAWPRRSASPPERVEESNRRPRATDEPLLAAEPTRRPEAVLGRVFRRAGRAIEAAVERVESGRAAGDPPVPTTRRSPARHDAAPPAPPQATRDLGEGPQPWRTSRMPRHQVRWPRAWRPRRRRDIPPRTGEARTGEARRRSRPPRLDWLDSREKPRHDPAEAQPRPAKPRPAKPRPAAPTAATRAPRRAAERSPREPAHPWPSLPGEGIGTISDDLWPELPDDRWRDLSDVAQPVATTRRARIDAEQRGA